MFGCAFDPDNSANQVISSRIRNGVVEAYTERGHLKFGLRLGKFCGGPENTYISGNRVIVNFKNGSVGTYDFRGNQKSLIYGGGGRN